MHIKKEVAAITATIHLMKCHGNLAAKGCTNPDQNQSFFTLPPTVFANRWGQSGRNRQMENRQLIQLKLKV